MAEIIPFPDRRVRSFAAVGRRFEALLSFAHRELTNGYGEVVTINAYVPDRPCDSEPEGAA